MKPILKINKISGKHYNSGTMAPAALLSRSKEELLNDQNFHNMCECLKDQIKDKVSKSLFPRMPMLSDPKNDDKFGSRWQEAVCNSLFMGGIDGRVREFWEDKGAKKKARHCLYKKRQNCTGAIHSRFNGNHLCLWQRNVQ